MPETFKFQPNICQQISGITALSACMGVQILRYYFEYLDRESKYFEVVGPHGGPVISEGVQILQHYSEVIGPVGPNTSKYLDRGKLFQGGYIFFVTVHS